MINGMEVSGNGHQTRHHLMAPKQQLQGSKQSQHLPVTNSHHHAFQSNGPYHQFPDSGAASGKRSGIPPSSPYSQSPSRAATRSPPPLPSGAGADYSGSLSQPPFFSLDVLPPFNPSLSPAHYTDSSSTTFVSDSVSNDVAMDDHDATSSRSPSFPSKNVGCGLPPLKSHRRSQSDIPLHFFQSSQTLAAAAPPPPPPQRGGLSFSSLAKSLPMEGKPENSGERGVDSGTGAGDDLFNAYMNLDGLDALNSSEDNREDFNSRDRVSKTNVADSSENEADSKMDGGPVGLWANQNFLQEHTKGGKRNSAGDLVHLPNPISRHCRSLSTDSFMGKLNFAEESLKPLPSSGLLSSQTSKGSSNGGCLNSFSLEFGNNEFSPAEMKKVMANEKLVEMAMLDPKRVKRILANRQSAARSKERKNKYIVELEHKVQALQTEATTLSAQVTLLQRDSVGLTAQNNELKFRLQAMEQQAQLRDALNEALTAEVQRLKLAVGRPADPRTSSNLNETNTNQH